MPNDLQQKTDLATKIGLSIGGLGVLIGLMATFSEDIGAGIFFSVMLTCVALYAWYIAVRPMSQRKKLLKTGELAEATIISLAENGSSIRLGGALPKAGVTIQLEVRPKGKPSYRAQTMTYISVLEVAKYQLGSVFQVKFDPANPQKVAIVE